MGGKGGGGYDAAPMIEQGEKALALQRQMYDDGVERTQPYYDAGTSSLGMLADLMGINGGSQQSRDQVYDGMKDQFTTTTQAMNNGMYTTPEGAVVDMNDRGRYYNPYSNTFSVDTDRDAFGISGGMFDRGDFSGMESLGYKPMGMQESTTSTNYDALNAAVDERMAGMGEKPEGFGSLLESFDMDKFQADPGYQFRLDEGNKAIERAAAARGQYFDPTTVKALSDYSGNQANQTYDNAYNRFNNDQNSIFNRLAAVSGIGQNANTTMVNSGANYANQAGNIYGQMGSAQTEANAANAAAPSMFDTLVGVGTQLGSAAIMSDERVKESIIEDGIDNGHQMYRFNYKGDKTRYRGVMAQDKLKTNPDAVVDIGGILHVNYERLGVEMTEVS